MLFPNPLIEWIRATPKRTDAVIQEMRLLLMPCLEVDLNLCFSIFIVVTMII
jgi:hypothetical protein